MRISSGTIFMILIISCQLTGLTSIAQQTHALNLAHPPAEAKIFGPGSVSTNLYERDMALSPDGREIYFTLQSPQGMFSTIMYMRKLDGDRWTIPQVASFSGTFSDMEPAFSADGNRLFFVSNRPIHGDSLKDFDIWFVDRAGGKWSTAVNLGAPVNTAENEFYPSVARNGNLYFTANYPRGKGKEDIYMATWANGKYAEPVSLDSGVNSGFYEFNAFVAPDESYLLFTSYGRKDDRGRGDLYISFREGPDHWKPAINLAMLNSERLDYCPFVSADQKILFFTSERSALKEKYPDHPATYRQLADTYNGILNGQANIYYLDFDRLIKELTKDPAKP